MAARVCEPIAPSIGPDEIARRTNAICVSKASRTGREVAPDNTTGDTTGGAGAGRAVEAVGTAVRGGGGMSLRRGDGAGRNQNQISPPTNANTNPPARRFQPLERRRPGMNLPRDTGED